MKTFEIAANLQQFAVGVALRNVPDFPYDP